MLKVFGCNIWNIKDLFKLTVLICKWKLIKGMFMKFEFIFFSSVFLKTELYPSRLVNPIIQDPSIEIDGLYEKSLSRLSKLEF